MDEELKQYLIGMEGRIASSFNERCNSLAADMESLKLATSAGLASLKLDTESLKLDMESLRLDMEALRLDMGSLRVDMEALRLDMGSLRVDLESLKLDMASLRVDVESLKLLVNDLHDSQIREIAEVKQSMERMTARLDKIAAGAHYVTRLVEWSEKQDKFQEDLLRRIQELERWRDQHKAS